MAKKRYLTGIQATGIPHLGNILGAIEPAIELSEKADNEAFYFIADLHSATQIKDAELLREHTYSVAAAWLAWGIDLEQVVFYRQSDVPEVTELTWFLNCFTPYPMLANAHSFKDKSDRLSDVNAGLFTYPVLQAADILLYDAHFVPVGKDQAQHLEMTRDIAQSFNHQMGETFVVPEISLRKDAEIVPGTDGQKMSKSYGNFISLFQTDKKLRKSVMKIVTDSKGVEEKKDPDTCTVYQLFSLVAKQDAVKEMRENYLKGGYGYGHAKQALYEVLAEKYRPQRERYQELVADKGKIDSMLEHGASRARSIAHETLNRVRERLGYLPK